MNNDQGSCGRKSGEYLRDHCLFGLGLMIEVVKQILFVLQAAGTTLVKPIPSEFIYMSVILVYVFLRIKRVCKNNGNSKNNDRYKGEAIVAFDGLVWFFIYVLYLLGLAYIIKIPEMLTLNLILILGLLGITKGFMVGDVIDYLFSLVKKIFFRTP